MILTTNSQYRAPNRRNYTFSLISFGEKAKTSCTAEFWQSKKQSQKKVLKLYEPTARILSIVIVTEAIQNLKSIFYLPKDKNIECIKPSLNRKRREYK